MYIGNRRRRRADRVHDALLGIHPDVRLHSEMPLVTFLGLVHLRIALLLFVLGRGRRVMKDRRFYDGVRRDSNALAAEIAIHRIQYLTAHIVRFQ